MKRKNWICIAVGALLFSCMPVVRATPAVANSAQTYFSGVDSTGAIMADKESPIIVEKELLTFDIGEFPSNYYESAEAFAAYKAKVTAEYTFYNPSAYTITAKLLFPFGNREHYAKPYYYDENGERHYYDDTAKYDITIDGQEIEKRVRHTLSSPYSQFELEQDLALIGEGYATDDFYSPDLTVTQYVWKVDGVDVEKYRAADVAIDIPKGVGNRRIYFPEQNGYHLQKDGDGRISTGVQKNEREFDLYVFGAPFTTLPTWTAYEDGGVKDSERIAGRVELVSMKTTTFEQFALSNYDAERAVSQGDWYNALVTELKNSMAHSDEYPIVNCSAFMGGFEQSLMRWYEYEITLAPEQRIVNAVTAPIYPSIDLRWNPAIFEYTYLLSPAKTWKSFGELEIVINTPYYLTESGLEGFTKTENGYVLRLAGLPDSELQFTLSRGENPQRVKSPYGFTDYNFWGIVAIVAIILGAAALVGGGVILAIRLRKKKK